VKGNTQLVAIALLLIVVAATGALLVRSGDASWLGYALVGTVFLLAVAGGIALRGGN
jgi:hypothetical protein